MVRFSARGSPFVPRHWWQRHPWVALCCGWCVIGALALAGVSRFWAPNHS